MPAESSLPSVLSRHLRYGRNLALIAEAVAAKYPGSPMIDVGANIGDTAILMRGSSDAPILCIEGSEMYADIFRSNLNESSKLTLIQKLVDTGDSTIGEILEEDGSGRASRNGNRRSVALADIASEHGFSNAKLIKIDTDGFDGRIIQPRSPGLRSLSRCCFGNSSCAETRRMAARVYEFLSCWRALDMSGSCSTPILAIMWRPPMLDRMSFSRISPGILESGKIVHISLRILPTCALSPQRIWTSTKP
jgi:FkbM family methyltransferase